MDKAKRYYIELTGPGDFRRLAKQGIDTSNVIRSGLNPGYYLYPTTIAIKDKKVLDFIEPDGKEYTTSEFIEMLKGEQS